MTRGGRAFIAFLAFLATTAAVVSLPFLPWSPAGMLTLAFFTAAACVAHVFHIILPRVYGAVFTIATACNIAVAIVIGPAAVLWSVLVSSAVASVILRRPLSRLLFNPSQLSLAFGLAALAYRSLWSGPPLANLWPALGAVVALGVTYFLINTGCVFLIVSLVEHTPFRRLWQQSARRIIVHDVVMVAVGTVFSILWLYNVWTTPLIVPLVVVLYQSMSAVGKMEQQTKEALLALAKVIDRRDCATYAHSERVAQYVGWICEELGLAGDETEVIIHAARLHDLGKVGVPDGLLLKPGRLTAEEQAYFRLHPDTGAEIVAQFPVFRDGAVVVRHEHEWYNGEGYPQGLRGEAIPLGARIIHVADAYEAMTSDRSYRKALPEAVAIERLIAGRQTQFDGRMVDAFLAALAKREALPLPAEPASLDADPLKPARDVMHSPAQA